MLPVLSDNMDIINHNLFNDPDLYCDKIAETVNVVISGKAEHESEEAREQHPESQEVSEIHPLRQHS